DTRVVVFTPTTENNTYWPQVYKVLEAAAADLDIELLGHEFPVEDRYAKHTKGLEILDGLEDIDGAIFMVAFGQTKPLLEATARRDIPVFIQGPLFETEPAEVGSGPRRRFENWIGLFSEAETEKGRRLAEILIERAVEAGVAEGDEAARVVGIGGDRTWYGSHERAEGLREAVRNERQALLKQVVPTTWTEAEGRRIARRLLERYPNTSVIWAASDQLAIGAYRAAREAGLTVGEDVWIGGLDLSARGLRYVDEGKLTATVASPLLGYAEILVYLHDYIHGRDFASEVGAEISLGVHTATGETAERYLSLYDSIDAIDFRSFSKLYDGGANGYDFSLEAYRDAVGR
ncbi:MAG: ABC transporter substrate-binding protein, partial [Spirochaetaceae bacterium]